jgi:hypothetical protein
MRTLELTPRLLAGLAAVAVIAVLESCGGDSASPEQFQSEGNRVCRDVEQQLDRIQAMPPGTADQAQKQAEAIIDVSEQALDNLRQLDPPEDLQPTFERYHDTREQAIVFVEDARHPAGDNDSDAYVGAKRRLAAEQPTRRQLALQLGLGACSRPSLPASNN